MNLENNEGALNEEIFIPSEHCRSHSSAAGAGCFINVGDFIHSEGCLGLGCERTCRRLWMRYAIFVT
jgi:hypothetical protein